MRVHDRILAIFYALRSGNRREIQKHIADPCPEVRDTAIRAADAMSDRLPVFTPTPKPKEE